MVHSSVELSALFLRIDTQLTTGSPVTIYRRITEVVLNEGSETETLPIADLIVDLPSGEQFATTDQIFGQDNNGVALEDAAKIFAPYVDIAPDLPKLDIKDLKVPNRTEDGTIKSGVRSPNGMPDRIK